MIPKTKCSPNSLDAISKKEANRRGPVVHSQPDASPSSMTFTFPINPAKRKWSREAVRFLYLLDLYLSLNVRKTSYCFALCLQLHWKGNGPRLV
jgi:hypothetical protein